MNRRNVIKNLSILGLTSLGDIQVNSAFGWDEKVSDESDAFGEVREIAKDIFFAKGKLTYFETGNYQEAECNNGWIIFDDFVLLIDANFPGKAPQLLQEIRKTTDKPVRYVFNTHHHGDHIYGNSFWANKGAGIIAHAGVVNELKKYETGYYSGIPGRWETINKKRNDLTGYSLLPPLLTFNDRMIIEDKHKCVELLHLGAGHTKGDGVVWIPDEKVLFSGDSCLTGPYNLFMDAQVEAWIATLDQMNALHPRILVPGHGKPGNADTVLRQKNYFKALFEWVKVKKTESADWLVLTQQLPELRQKISANKEISAYLIAETAKAPGFSLEAHVKKVFDQIH